MVGGMMYEVTFSGVKFLETFKQMWLSRFKSFRGCGQKKITLNKRII
jgi:hypothetical protein